MPTYQYRCSDCGTDLEVVQKFTDTALTECPTCGGSLRKVFNAVGVVFKGSGFYRTDSRAANGKDGSSSGSSKESSSSGDSSSAASGSKDAGPSKDAAKSSGSDSTKDSKATPKPAAPAATPSSSTGG